MNRAQLDALVLYLDARWQGPAHAAEALQRLQNLADNEKSLPPSVDWEASYKSLKVRTDQLEQLSRAACDDMQRDSNGALRASLSALCDFLEKP